MSENYDLDSLAMSLLPKIPGLLMVDGVQRQLRGISWNYLYAPAKSGTEGVDYICSVVGTQVDAIYSAREESHTGLHPGVHAVPLYFCSGGIEAEALCVALRELVYPRERLAGRMKPNSV
jgi:hypothetical protein